MMSDIMLSMAAVIAIGVSLYEIWISEESEDDRA